MRRYLGPEIIPQTSPNTLGQLVFGCLGWGFVSYCSCAPGSKLPLLGMVIPPLIGSPYSWSLDPTVDGRDPAPPGMYKTYQTLWIMRYLHYLPYQLASRISSINSNTCVFSLCWRPFLRSFFLGPLFHICQVRQWARTAENGPNKTTVAPQKRDMHLWKT